MVERFKVPTVEAELRRLVNEQPHAVLDVPEALRFLVGDSLDARPKPSLQVSRGESHWNCETDVPFISGFPCGHLSPQSRLSITSSHDTMTTLCFCNTQ